MLFITLITLIACLIFNYVHIKIFAYDNIDISLGIITSFGLVIIVFILLAGISSTSTKVATWEAPWVWKVEKQ